MSEKETGGGLFTEELQILEKAKLNISDTCCERSKILEGYSELAESYEKLLKLTNKAFKISDAQGRELKRREYEVKMLLDNSNQGFLTFGGDLKVDKEYSEECIRIFNRKIGNMNILELLSDQNPEQHTAFAAAYEQVFNEDDPEKQYDILRSLPSMLKINDNYVNVQYRLINLGEYDTRHDLLMLILTDITEKRKTEDQVFYLSYHDKLTSLYNRAYIDNIVPQLQSDINMPLSIIMADMNGLKLTNDVFGHESGDRLLVNAAKVFLQCCRKSDIVARWGGDEFLIILPGTDQAASRVICDRIREACRNAVQEPIELSISLGTATMENSKMNISELFGIAENMMYSNKLTECKDVRTRILLSLEKVLNTRCFEDAGHTERLIEMTERFGKITGIAPGSVEARNLRLLASLHDIGKVAIPKEILGKQGALTQNEWEIMKSHTEIGFRMAQSIEEPMLAQAILALREHWDGSGYPYGLKEGQIPFMARVVAVLDAYDVMTHDRPYKKALSRDEAVLELKRCSGTHFDPELVEMFLMHMDALV